MSALARRHEPVWKTAGVPGSPLTTRQATPDDVGAVLAIWQSNWARWVKPLGRRPSGA